VSFVVGDGRLEIGAAPDASYDMIVVDAFSSDAIPIHLMTREAMAIYLQKTANTGLIVMHVSNRHLELTSVVAGVAAANGAITREYFAGDEDREDRKQEYSDSAYLFSSVVSVVGRTDADFGELATRKSWAVTEPDSGQWVWTDDYSNIIGALVRNMR
jgi:hypothetical protein